MTKFTKSITICSSLAAVLGSRITLDSGHDAIPAKPLSSSDRYYLEEPNFQFWQDTQDDILTEFKYLMSKAEKKMGSTIAQSESSKSLQTLQRFAELVDMIMYVQKVPFFGQYWYYGCWCAPDGFFNPAQQGYGKPVDSIDRSCRAMSYCYECARLDHGQECNSDQVNYRWHGTMNPVTGKKEIVCDDKPGTCAHSLCSCDKSLAQELAIHEDSWNLHHHRKWGDFNRDECYVTEENAQVNSQNQQAFATDDGAFMQRAFGDALSDNVPAIQLKFAKTFADPDEKYCCGEYGNVYNNRKPLKKRNNSGGEHNEKCCYADSAVGFSGTPFNSGKWTCDSITGKISELGDAS